MLEDNFEINLANIRGEPVGRGSEESDGRATVIRQTRPFSNNVFSDYPSNHEAAVSKLSNKRRVSMADMRALAVFD
jgi:hypothetical protein